VIIFQLFPKKKKKNSVVLSLKKKIPVVLKNRVLLGHCLRNPQKENLSWKYKSNMYKSHNYSISKVKPTNFGCLNNALRALVSIFLIYIYIYTHTHTHVCVYLSCIIFWTRQNKTYINETSFLTCIRSARTESKQSLQSSSTMYKYQKAKLHDNTQTSQGVKQPTMIMKSKNYMFRLQPPKK